MLLAVSYLLLTLALSAFFHFFSPPPSPFFVFWLGLLSGASWGNAWSLSVGTTIHVCVFLFVSRAFFPHPCICSNLPLWAKCFDQMSQLVVRRSYHHRHDHDQRRWHLLCLCYVAVFGLHKCITCSPLMEHILTRVSRTKYKCTTYNRAVLSDYSLRGSRFYEWKVFQIFMNVMLLTAALHNKKIQIKILKILTETQSLKLYHKIWHPAAYC